MTYALKDLNKAAAAHDLELVKGDGYFYWVHPERVDIPSVYVAAFSHADRAFWEAELVEAAYHDKLMAERDGLINEMALECVAEYKRRYK